MHIEKNVNKIICEITHAKGKYSEGLLRPEISKGSFKLAKYMPPFLPGHKEFKKFCSVCSRVFVLSINKLAPPFLWQNCLHR